MTDWTITDLFAYLNSKEARLAVDRHDTPKHLLWSIREVLQLYGTEIVRRYKPNYWVDEVERRYLAALLNNPKTVAIVTDTRFDNEALLVRQRDGILYQVIRDSAVLTGEHKSEAGLSDYSDCIKISNNSSLADLQLIAATTSLKISI